MSGNYGFITGIGEGDTDTLAMAYTGCVSFLTQCQIPRHVRGRTLFHFQSFGATGFTAEVCHKLTNWAKAILSLASKLEQNSNVPLGSAKDRNNFNQLVQICAEIVQKVNKADKVAGRSQQ